MDIVCITLHIVALCDVVAVVASVLGGVDASDLDHVDLLAVWGSVISRHPQLAAVLDARDEGLDFFFFLKLTLFLIFLIGDVLLLEDAAPIVVVDFHEVGDSGMVSELRHLADGDESGDIIPFISEDSTVVGNWIVLTSGSRETCHDGKYTRLTARTITALP